jgi:hypothetical protein
MKLKTLLYTLLTVLVQGTLPAKLFHITGTDKTSSSTKKQNNPFSKKSAAKHVLRSLLLLLRAVALYLYPVGQQDGLGDLFSIQYFKGEHVLYTDSQLTS